MESIPRYLLAHFPESFRALPGIFSNITWNLLEHFPEPSWAIPGIFSIIPQNLFEDYPESSWTFARIFPAIPRNPLEHSLESSRNVKMITLNPSEQFPRSLHSPYSVLRSCIPGFENSLNFNYLTSSYPFTIQKFFYPLFCASHNTLKARVFRNNTMSLWISPP